MQDIYHIPAPDMNEKQVALVRLDGFNIISLTLPPITSDTTLESLTNALSKQISSPCPLLLGFCYGGVLAQEIAKTIPAASVIVVSSITSCKEIPMTHKLLAKSFYYLPTPALKSFGYLTKFLANSVLRLPIKIPRIWLKTNQNKFIIKHSLQFQGLESTRVFRIHGASDRIIPNPDKHLDRSIDSGGHFMFFQNKHREVLAAIKDGIIELQQPGTGFA